MKPAPIDSNLKPETSNLQPAPPDDPLAIEFLGFMATERHSSSRTVANYELALRKYRTWCKEFKGWAEQSSDDFRKYLFALMKKDVARATIRLEFAAFRSLYRYLQRRRAWKAQSTARCATTQAREEAAGGADGEGGGHDVGTATENRARKASSRLGSRAGCGYFGGLLQQRYASSRVGLSLNVEDVDVISECARVMGKGRKERICPLGSHALLAIQRYRAKASVQSGPLFISKRRTRITTQPWGMWWTSTGRKAVCQCT